MTNANDRRFTGAAHRRPTTGARLRATAINMLVPAALLLGAWSLIALSVSHFRGAPFPGPLDTAVRMGALLAGEELLDHTIYAHLRVTLTRWASGFVMGALGGIVIAVLIGWSRLAERGLMPIIYMLQLIPGLAWIPVAILLFGLGNSATVFMITVTALAPVAINMVAGIKGASEQHLRVAAMAGARRRDTFLSVLLPGAIPHLTSGLRVGLGNSWRVVVAAEMIVGTGSGLGFSIIQSRWTLDYTSAFVCIGIICLIGLLIEYIGFAQLEAATIRRWGMQRS